jgi:eukaryotic-like serine/threonine-protein kinase
LAPHAESECLRFAEFELDLRTGELVRNGQKTILQEQTFQILAALLERPGQLITRDEFRKRLWSSDTFVDFDQGLNKGVNRLRDLLEDSAEHPRFIETLPRRGYRFIALVEQVKVQTSHASGNFAGKKISHYRLLEILGGGGMGVVYKAEDLKLGRRVAMKFLPEELGKDKKALERFEREARAVSALDHPNICPIYEFGEHDDQPFMVMPLLEGQTLRERIAARISNARAGESKGRPHKAAFTTEELLNLALQIADGLQTAHEKGIVHRDIKPANVFLTNLGEAKILDFGLAKVAPAGAATAIYSGAGTRDENCVPESLHQETPTEGAGADPGLTRTGVALGTAAYMSPEQVRGEKLDERTDLFSFGLLLYEMAAGRQAFTGETAAILHDAILHDPPAPLGELHPEFPFQIEIVINKALQKDRELRYQSASRIRADLTAVAETLREQTGDPRVKLAFLTRGPAMVAGVAALFLVAITIWFANGPQSTVPALKQRQLTGNSSENPVGSAAISPNGKYLAYADRKGIHLGLTETGETQTIPQPEVFRKTYVDWDIKAWLPDSTRFHATAWVPGERRSIWTVSVLGGTPRKIRDDGIAWSVSPDGAWLAFTTSPGSGGDREIWLMGPDGEHAHKLYEAGGQDYFERVEWSPDGHRLLYEKQLRAADKIQESLESRDLQGGPASIILNTPPYWEKDGLRDFYWMRDGRLIYLIDELDRNRPACNYWEMRVDVETGESSGKPRRLTDWAGFCMDHTGAAADGRRLIFTKFWDQHVVYLADLESRGMRISIPRRLTLSDGEELPIAWMNDSRSLLFESNRNGQWSIFRQALDEDISAHVIASIPGRPELDSDMLRTTPRMSADGGWVFYPVLPEKNSSSTVFQLMTAPIAEGTPQLTSAVPLHNMPHCARSPATLCVIADRAPGSRKLNFKSFDAVQGPGGVVAQIDVRPNDSYSWDLSPDGKLIAVVPGSAGQIHILSQSGQPPQSRVLNVKDWSNFVRLDWAADGKALFASSVAPQGSVLLRIDLLGNARVLWRQAGESDMSTYAVPSPDGRHLAISGYSSNSNVWLMEDF